MGIKTQIKAISYLVKARPFLLEKPVVLQFPVIDICNSQCQMCRIWENKKSDDLTPQDLRKGLRNPLFSEVSGVGLNGGEPTLRKDLGELTAVLFEELPKLRGVSLITNAYRHEEVVQRITEVGSVVRKHGGQLDVMVSLDGYGDMHDLVRGKPGNFERAKKVLDFVQSSPLVSSVRIGCTIIKANVYGLADLFEFCQGRNLYIKYRLGVPHQRLYTQNLADPYALSAADKYHVAEFMEGLIAHYETSAHQKFFYRSLIDQLVRNAPRQAGCDWQHRGATITSKGELLYCAVQSKVLGRIHEQDSEQAYFGNAAHLREIIDTKCADCHHDYVGIPPKGQYLRQLGLQAAQRLRVAPLLRKAYDGLHVGELRNRRHFAQRRTRMQALAAQPLPAAAGPAARVLICGWYGTETLGDKGILGGVLHALRQTLGPLDVTLVALHPYVSEMTRRQMDELKGCRIVEPQQGIRLAAGMDLVVFGGGPLMAIHELAEMEAIFTAAHARNVATMVAGCGVGPLGEPWHNASIRNILSLASLRIYRDARSRELAAGLGVDTARDIVAEDPAFTWLHEQRGRLQRAPAGGRKVLLLGLRDFPYATYARHLNTAQCLQAKQRYEVAVTQALEQLAARHADLVIRPLPMCTNHFGDDDRWFYRRLFRGNEALQPRLDLSLLGAELSPLEYCEAFASASVALTMRFHSLVFALGLQVPALAIDYTLGRGKVQALAQRFGVAHQNLAELEADFIVREVEQLLAAPRAQAQSFEPSFTDAVRRGLPALLPSLQPQGLGA
ncbi:polysaccharide pyruvyl transferase family protein [Azohydromonas lata]|uniref:polysaccharide pyruvyl transferase family protein n=1 Tax=Azohydromonas lata TaxID=45677 RepID=UPI000ABA5E1B|nr:polysaccharide pyruvyl transferase family protein [Azohydromonas lata]